MKILYISTDAHQEKFNAGKTHTFSLTDNLILLKNKVCLIINGNHENLINYRRNKLVTLQFKALNSGILKKIYFLFYNNYLILRGIRKYKIKFDIIYERHNASFFASAILSKIKSIPLVYEVNGIPDEEAFIANNIKNVVIKKIINILCRFELACAKSIIVQTQELKNILENRFNLNNIYIVENGTNFSSTGQEHVHPNKLFTLSFVGALGDFHNLSQILDILKNTEINFNFLIIGDGQYKELYLRRYENDKRFKFMGQVDHSNVKKYIIESDICIASYNLKLEVFNKYGFYFCPLKLLEYSSLGKPTIVYGFRNSFISIFEKMNCCIVVNNGQDLINSISVLMKNSKKVEEMSINARKASGYYSWEKAAKKTEVILKYATEATK